jgi:hypothetical protein
VKLASTFVPARIEMKANPMYFVKLSIEPVLGRTSVHLPNNPVP